MSVLTNYNSIQYRLKHGIPLDAPKFLKKPPIVRWWRFVRKTKKGCWLWTGSQMPAGYGQFVGKEWGCVAHRFAYITFVGPIPDGLQLDHLCRVRHCVNPKHLEAVTARENTLRGISFSAKNHLKTHCLKGHPLSGDNLYQVGRRRHCRLCRNETMRELRRKKRA